MNGTELKKEEAKEVKELKEEEAGFSLGGCCGEEERPPVVDCHLSKEQGIPPGASFPPWSPKNIPRTPISPKSTLLLFSLWRILRVST